MNFMNKFIPSGEPCYLTLIPQSAWESCLDFREEFLAKCNLVLNFKFLFLFGKRWVFQSGKKKMSKMCYICNRILFNHKRDKIVLFAATWMDLEGIMLSQISQMEKVKYYMISFINRG